MKKLYCFLWVCIVAGMSMSVSWAASDASSDDDEGPLLNTLQRFQISASTTFTRLNGEQDKLGGYGSQESDIDVEGQLLDQAQELEEDLLAQVQSAQFRERDASLQNVVLLQLVEQLLTQNEQLVGIEKIWSQKYYDTYNALLRCIQKMDQRRELLKQFEKQVIGAAAQSGIQIGLEGAWKLAQDVMKLDGTNAVEHERLHDAVQGEINTAFVNLCIVCKEEEGAECVWEEGEQSGDERLEDGVMSSEG